MYGSRFDETYGDALRTGKTAAETAATWASELAGFEPEDLRNALDALGSAYPDRPPTLFQFRGLCTDSKRRRAQMAVKLPGPREPLPERAKTILADFLSKHRVGGPRA